MLPTCGNAVQGLDHLRLNHSSTTRRHRRTATAGRDRTKELGHPGSDRPRQDGDAEDAEPEWIEHLGPLACRSWSLWLTPSRRSPRPARSRVTDCGDGYQGHPWHGQHNTGVRICLIAERNMAPDPRRAEICMIARVPALGRRIESGVLVATRLACTHDGLVEVRGCGARTPASGVEAPGCRG